VVADGVREDRSFISQLCMRGFELTPLAYATCWDRIWPHIIKLGLNESDGTDLGTYTNNYKI
jgi:hypothetical protein